MKELRQGRSVWMCLTMTVALLLFVACSSLQFAKEGVGASGSRTAAARKSKNSPLYHDFGDVLIPSELKIDKRLSFIYHTPGFSGGVLSLKGRVEMNSLIAFFETNMSRDNWRLISSFKSPRTIMLFHKENKWCVTSISEKEFNTYVEIWVAPTVNEMETRRGDDGLLK